MACIYWILVGPSAVASSRIHGIRIHEFLLASGHRSEVLFAPFHYVSDPPIRLEDCDSPIFAPGDVVVLQKVNGPWTRALIAAFRRIGIPTIFLDSDMPLKLPEARLATEVVCSSKYLAEQYAACGISRVVWIPDAYEVLGAAPRASGDRKLRCIWFGYSNCDRESQIQKLQREIFAGMPDCELVVTSNATSANSAWSIPEVWDLIRSCDVAVLSGDDTPESFAKSSNRAIQAMALGLPVVAFPIPAYREVIRDGHNGYLCASAEQWRRALRRLRNPRTRTRCSAIAYRFARRYYDVEHIGPIWLSLFTQLAAESGESRIPGNDDRDIVRNLNTMRHNAYMRLADILRNLEGARTQYCRVLASRADLAAVYRALGIRSGFLRDLPGVRGSASKL